MRLIDIDKRFEEWQELLKSTFPLLPCQMPHQFFLNAPTVDAEPVRHGKWAHKYYPTVWYGPGEPPEWICSECQDRAYNTYDYCPNCGAKMDLK